MSSVTGSFESPRTAAAADPRGRLWVFACLAALLVLAGLAYFPTYASMVGIWLRSETFLHGILILPISAWLIWRRWPSLRRAAVAPAWPGLAAVLGVSLTWWVSDAAGIQVGAQFAAVAMLPALVVAIAGLPFARAIAFPLAYLAFAVPFGEGAIPYLIDFTATFTVEALQVTGFPVLREGAFFSIPAGDFEVARACSGIRYLLASLALGTLYGYLVFRSLKKRLLFFAFALLLPIVANGLRAYGIVLIAHYSDMRLAVGVDHLIFGWIFFGVVMLLMFWVGDRYRDRPVSDHEVDRVAVATTPATVRTGAVVATSLVAALLLAAGPVFALATTGLSPARTAPALPLAIADWRPAETPADLADWAPNYVDASHELQRQYLSSAGPVDFAVVRYDGVAQGAEVANAMNTAADLRSWRRRQVVVREVDIGRQAPLAVREVWLTRGAEQRLVWVWHEVDGRPVRNDFETKWREVQSLLRFREPLSAAFLAATPRGDDPDAARARLARFVTDGWGRFQDCLYGIDAPAAACLGGDPAGTNSGNGN